MTGGHRRWLLALGAAAIVATVGLGGAALAGSLLSSADTPLFEKGDPGAARSLVTQAHVFDQTDVSTPADDQYGNPLEGKLCADPAELDLATPRMCMTAWRAK